MHELRYYQKECIEAIENGPAKCLAVLATGAGKSVIMGQIPRQGRMLCCVHREDLLYSNGENFDCPVGYEKAEITSNNEEVVIASVQSMFSRYKKFDPKSFDTIVLDECFRGDTEVLTSRGWIKFEETKKDEIVAQYDINTKKISYVKPERKIEKYFYGNLIEYKSDRFGKIHVTPNHRMYFNDKFSLAKDIISNPKYRTSGLSEGEDELTCFEKFAIMYQADGSYTQAKTKSYCVFGLTKKRKIEKMLQIAKECNFSVKELKQSQREGCGERRRFAIKANKEYSKYISKEINISKCSEIKCKKIIEEMVLWDGHIIKKDEQYYYSSIIKENADFYQIAAMQAGYFAQRGVQKDDRKKEYSDVHRLYITKKECKIKDGQALSTKMKKEGYLKNHRGKVYCFTMPKGTLIVRSSSDKNHPIIVGNCHHYTANKYKEVVDYFNPRKLIGLTATPERADGIGLDNIFDEIVYSKDLKELISEGYLCPVKCFKVDVGYDLSAVTSRLGDFTISELKRQVHIEGATKAIQKIIEEHDGSFIVACVDVRHAEDIAKAVGGIAVTANTPNRMQIIEDYKKGKIKTLTTVNVLSEGSNLPIAKNLIMAAPTQSKVKYIQLAGRIMRLHPEKKECRIFDLVGNTGKHQIAGPHTLIGMDIEDVPKSNQIELIGDLLNDLPRLIKKKADCPETWIKNIKSVELFSKKNNWNTHNVNYFKHPDGKMIVALPDKKWIGITKPNHIGRSRIITSKGIAYDENDTQENFDEILRILKKHCKKESPIWNTKSIKRWGRQQTSPKQLGFARRLLKENGFIYFNLPTNSSKLQVSCIINRLNKNAIQQECKRSNKEPKIRIKFGSSI